MSNSSLISYTKLSPNYNEGRLYDISRISIHCVVGQCSVETLGNIFAVKGGASCNYGIGYDARVGMYCEEKNRSWCTSSRDNDNRAVTIETASDKTKPYAVKDIVFNKLLDLCEDICRRNGKKKLIWIEDKDKALAYEPKKDEMLLTVHRWFADKSCPGTYLFSRHAEIAEEVTKRLNKEENKESSNKEVSTVASAKFKKGDLVSIKKGATYYTGKDIPNWVENIKWYVEKVDGSRVIISKSEDGKYNINSPVNAKYLTLEKAAPFIPYLAKVTATSLNIRKGPGTNYEVIGKITNQAIYTIIDESIGEGATRWGLLKSHANKRDGWISLDYTKNIF